jgi:hypothetical protein
MPNPMLLHRHFPPALHDRVARELAHVGRGELVYLRRARILFEQVRGGEVELEGVVWARCVSCVLPGSPSRWKKVALTHR